SVLLIEDAGQYYGFFTDAGILKRIRFGNSPLNTPSAPENVIDSPLGNSRALCAYVQNGIRYIFAHQSNANPSALARFDFGDSFGNTPAAQTINAGNVISNPGQMQLVRDVDGSIKLLVGCIQGSRVALINFGNDVTNNTPSSTIIPIPGNWNNWAVDIIRTCAGWQMIAGGGNKLSLFNLGNTIDPDNTAPTLVGEIVSGSVGNLLSSIVGVKLFGDEGKWFVLVENSGPSGTLANHTVVLGLGNAGALSVPATYAANFSGPGDALGLSGLRFEGQNIFLGCLAYGGGGTGGQLYLSRFIPPCDLPPFTGIDPPPVMYQNPGCRNIGLYAQSNDGTNHIYGLPICVSGAVADFSTSVACSGSITTFFNQTQAFAPNATQWQWNFGDQS
ncbi:MAG: hypothetical protein RMM53_13395, partial [Bacteroidia bacterium]|nr:hypothetical protein [Bacteroidia bacterium]